MRELNSALPRGPTTAQYPPFSCSSYKYLSGIMPQVGPARFFVLFLFPTRKKPQMVLLILFSSLLSVAE